MIDEDAPAPRLPSFPRIMLGDVELLPAPSGGDGMGARWCVPGGGEMTTADLLDIAQQRGISLILKLN